MVVEWTTFKSFIDSRKLSVQWVDLGNQYWLKAFDDGFSLECFLDKNPPDATNLNVFVNSYKDSGNKTPYAQIPVKTDTFTTMGVGAILEFSRNPKSSFSLSVVATGLVKTWSVSLEGSLDGVNFSTIMIHTDLVGNGKVLFSGALAAPCLYFRTNCTALVLGLGTNITSMVLGV